MVNRFLKIEEYLAALSGGYKQVYTRIYGELKEFLEEKGGYKENRIKRVKNSESDMEVYYKEANLYLNFFQTQFCSAIKDTDDIHRKKMLEELMPSKLGDIFSETPDFLKNHVATAA